MPDANLATITIVCPNELPDLKLLRRVYSIDVNSISNRDSIATKINDGVKGCDGTNKTETENAIS
jgi:hypothetical protein